MGVPMVLSHKHCLSLGPIQSRSTQSHTGVQAGFSLHLEYIVEDVGHRLEAENIPLPEVKVDFQ